MNLIRLFVVTLILFFFGSWLIPITDPTESVYMLTAKEMLAAGDWLSPRIYGNFWFDKPIFFYLELLTAYYYALISAIGFFPWTIPLIFFAAKRLRRLPTFGVNEKFLIVWALTVIIFFNSARQNI